MKGVNNMISIKDFYLAYMQLTMHSESIRWSRLTNWFTANSILILAWVAIYISNERENIPYSSFVMFIISIVGGLCCFAWQDLGRRGSKFVKLHFNQAFDIENYSTYLEDNIKNIPEYYKPFTRARNIRDSAKWYSKSSFLVQAVPILFLFLYAVLFYVSIKLL